MTPLDPLPLPDNPSFPDLIFRQHPDGRQGHTQALHTLGAGRVSITCGGLNLGEPRAPYEMQSPDGEIHAPLTADDVTRLLQQFSRAPGQ